MGHELFQEVVHSVSLQHQMHQLSHARFLHAGCGASSGPYSCIQVWIVRRDPSPPQGVTKFGRSDHRRSPVLIIQQGIEQARWSGTRSSRPWRTTIAVGSRGQGAATGLLNSACRRVIDDARPSTCGARGTSARKDQLAADFGSELREQMPNRSSSSGGRCYPGRRYSANHPVGAYRSSSKQRGRREAYGEANRRAAGPAPA